MPYVDPNTIHNPATGTVAPAAWGDQIRDNGEFLIDPPACSVTHSVFQSCATSTWTLLSFDTESFDNNAMHSTVTNNSRITAQTAGRYQFLIRMTYPADATGERAAGYRVNGTGATPNVQVGAYPACGGGVDTVIVSTWSLVLAASDYVELYAWQNRGSNLTVGNLEFYAKFLTR